MFIRERFAIKHQSIPPAGAHKDVSPRPEGSLFRSKLYTTSFSIAQEKNKGSAPLMVHFLVPSRHRFLPDDGGIPAVRVCFPSRR